MFRHPMARRGFMKTLGGVLLALLGMRYARGTRPAAAAVPPAVSRVVTVHDSRASLAGKGLDNADLDPAVVRRMVNGGVLAFTGETDLRRAWLKIIPDPTKKVAIKVNCQIRGIYTKANVVQPLVEGLLSIGVPADNIIIYDMTDKAFDLAGFVKNRGPGVKVGTVADFGGYSRFLFHRLANLLTGGHEHSGWNYLAMLARDSRFGSVRFVSSMLVNGRTRPWDCAYLINVPVLKALDGYSGVTLSMKNHYGSIANPGEHHDDIMEYIPFVNSLPEIRTKTRLIVLDAIFGEYKWVNGRDQKYVERVNRVIVSNDPVAVDATGWRMIEEMRAKHRLGPVQPQPAFIARAASMGLGNMAHERIQHLTVETSGVNERT
ncbi:DUF362 domain-containing protein [Geobacter sulfurreducens]|nr:DUF362 domain-containing protein [Geobacter sulfurreducens]